MFDVCYDFAILGNRVVPGVIGDRDNVVGHAIRLDLARAGVVVKEERLRMRTLTSGLKASSCSSQLRMADLVGIPSLISILRGLKPSEIQTAHLSSDIFAEFDRGSLLRHLDREYNSAFTG